MSEKHDYKWMVSVSCMTFNHAPYIVDAMNGFTMQQTSFAFVCTIIDDASTDGEQDVIKNYLNEHFDLEDRNVVRHEETDDYLLTFARHKTNHNCFFAVLFLKYNHYSIKKWKQPYIAEWEDNTKYIAVCEGDDYWITQNKLQNEVNILENDSMVGIVRTDANRYYQDSGIMQEKIMSRPPFNRIKDTFEDYLVNAWFNAPCTTVWRKSALKDLILSSKYTVGNLPRILTITKAGYKSIFLNEVTAVYRVLSISASHFDSSEKAYTFKKGVIAVEKDYCKDVSKNIKYKLFFNILCRRLGFLKGVILSFLKKIIRDTKQDYRDLFINC